MNSTPNYNSINNEVHNPPRQRVASSHGLLSPVIMEPNKSNGGIRNHHHHHHPYRPSTSPTSPSNHIPPPFPKHRRGSEVDHRTIIKLFLTTCFILVALFCFNRFLYFWSYVHESISIEESSKLIKEIPSTLFLKNYLSYFGNQKRLAGSKNDQSLANLTLLQWQQFGMTDLQIETFYPTLNQPLYHEISIFNNNNNNNNINNSNNYNNNNNNNNNNNQPSIIYQSSFHSLREESSIPFHGYSKDGNVTGPIIYVNDGTINDFNYLKDQGIQFNGTIALIRGGGEMEQASMMTGSKVMLAEKYGCIGVLIYADPGDLDGPIEKEEEQEKIKTNSHDHDLFNHHAYPNGPWRPNYSIPYASVMNKAIMVGDPWTPGVPILSSSSSSPPSSSPLNEEENHQPKNTSDALPNIPSIPISWDHASQLLKLTNGFGITSPPKEWIGGDNQNNTIFFHSGPSQSFIRLVNQNLYQQVPIENVIARIPGQVDTYKSIIIGCQRDSFSTSGIIESASSSAIMHELVRTFGLLLKKGWRPNRSIILISWDASSYGLVGSTEWVELHKEWVYEQSIAYIDIGSVSGNQFDAQGSPLLHRLLYQVTQDVFDPQQSQSIYDAWKKNRYMSSSISTTTTALSSSSSCITNNTLPSQLKQQQQDEDEEIINPFIKKNRNENDYKLNQENKNEDKDDEDDEVLNQDPFQPVLVDPLNVNNDGFAFFQHVGIPTLSLRFKNNQFGVSNSEEDNLDWMNKFGDSTFTYHQALVRIVGLLTLRLSSEQLLPMYPLDYARLLLKYADDLSATHDCRPLPSLTTSLLMLQSSSTLFYRKSEKYRHQLKVKEHYSKKLKKHMKKHNQAVTKFERSFLDPMGLPPYRPWLKHAIYSPHPFEPAKTIIFPSILQAIQKHQPVYTRQMEERVTAMIMTAHDTLRI
ncbi:unnamed protein product [Cunninghamella blakesleeana]